MNLIVCDKNCMHQQEGYCTLDRPVSLTNSQSDCAYFSTKSSLTKSSDSLRNISDTNNL